MHPLRAERLRKGWTQRQLADFSLVSISTVERAERGEPISLDSRQRLSECLNKTYEQLGLLVSEADLNGNATKQEALPPTRFLTMQPEELLKRYAGEKEHLLELKTQEIAWTLPQVVVIDNSQLHIAMSAIHVQVDELHPEYTIPEKIAGKAEDILEEVGHHFHDSATIRLNGICIQANDITLIVSKAHYLQYIATNYALDALLKEKGWTRSLRDRVHLTDHLCSLEESLLANHIGIGTLVFTLDNYLIIPVRSKEKVGIWRQEISPSISGATNYDDDMYSLQSGPIATWMREGREELGIDNSDFIEESSIFLGMTRELLRGGKPEMFFATRLHLTKAKLEQKFKRARDAWENKELKCLEFTDPLTPPASERERSLFSVEFLRLVNMYQNLLSPPARANLTLWYRYMTCSRTNP